jgi:hypothetical protein
MNTLHRAADGYIQRPPGLDSGNNAHAQRRRLEAALRQGPVTTIQARHELDILMPASRVHELRWKYGLNIQTHIRREKNPGGEIHEVAMYVLQPGHWEGRA